MRSQRLSMLVAIVGVIAAAAVMVNLVPRIRLVEAITLFATAFSAGAGFAATLVRMRSRSDDAARQRSAKAGRP